MRLLVWLLRVVVFLALFALALNNQHAATLYSFFGLEWHTRMIYIVLAAFVTGCAVGVLAMMPRWWRGRRARPTPAVVSNPGPASTSPMPLRPVVDAAASQYGAEAALPPGTGGRS